jgi:hypothetical protein
MATRRMTDGGKPSDVPALTAEERTFLARASDKYHANVNWLEFEEFAFGMRSPIYAKKQSHPNVVEHPLYVALKGLWLDLGVRQGRIAPAVMDKVADAPRRETPRRR